MDLCLLMLFFLTISLSGLLSSSLVRHDLILQFGIVIFFLLALSVFWVSGDSMLLVSREMLYKPAEKSLV